DPCSNRVASMLRSIASWTLFAVVGVGILFLKPAQPQQSQAPTAGNTTEYRAVLTRYCFTCHNEKLKTGGLALDKVDLNNIPAGAETWEKVIRKLRGNAMPP